MTLAERVAKNARQSARLGGLHYASDDQPGILRKSQGRGWKYVDSRGKPVRTAQTLSRIRTLAIPPAWTDVWIARDADDHLQATGRDVKGRKQYRYHPRWREVRDDDKYGNLVGFAKALPRIRRRIDRDLGKRGLPRQKVLAAVVKLLETTLIRVGNDEYARQNHSFGLTTMRDRHVRVRGSTVRFSFRGKSGKDRDLIFNSARMAKIVKRCQDLPGQELFQYVDEQGQVRDIGSAEVNGYLREISGRDITAKDFRTWAGTALAAEALRQFETFDSHAAAKRNITKAIERVAARLGNTTTICRKCYVHPAVIDAYMDHSLVQTLRRRTERELSGGLSHLSSEEAAVLALLQQRLRHKASSQPRRRPRRKSL